MNNFDLTYGIQECQKKYDTQITRSCFLSFIFQRNIFQNTADLANTGKNAHVGDLASMTTIIRWTDVFQKFDQYHILLSEQLMP